MKVLTNLIFAALLMMVGSNICYAQEVSIRGGLNLSQMLIKLDGQQTQEDSKLNPGFHIGPVIDFQINSLFSFETGLLYSTKGYKELSNLTIDTNSSTRINIAYLDVPLTIKTSLQIKKVLLFANGGGYIASGLFGDILSKEDVDGIYGSWQKIVWGDQDGSFQRLDYGVDIGLGVKYKAMQFGICYEYGIANIAGYNRSETKAHNRVTELYLSYALWNKSNTKN